MRRLKERNDDHIEDKRQTDLFDCCWSVPSLVPCNSELVALAADAMRRVSRDEAGRYRASLLDEGAKAIVDKEDRRG